MRIGILTQWYPPEPAQIPETLAKGLTTRGHDVTVLTGYPNYPTGAIYEGYKQRLHTVESQNGVEVHRVPVYPSHDRSALRRLGSFASFAASSSVLGYRALAKVDVVYVYHPPATAGALAGLKHWLGHTPFMLHVQDLWPDSVLDSGMVAAGPSTKVVNTGLNILCNSIYRAASSIVVISDGMGDVLVNRGVPSEKILRIYNWVDESIFHPRATPTGSQREWPR